VNDQIGAINQQVKETSAFVDSLFAETSKVIVGQKPMLERIVIGFLANGHILLEGVPGLAKTTSVKTLAAAISTTFKRIQFTPDLLPADLIGTMIYNQKEATFQTRKGPVFTNILLADEINRAPAKVQSALLEGMQERQVTIGDETFRLPDPFLVLATQNPIEQEGTYPLPEAQVDRFMLKVTVGYPTKREEAQIVSLCSSGEEPSIRPVIGLEQLFAARKLVNQIYVDDKVKSYILDIIFAAREPETYGLADLKPLIAYGPSPRASIYLTVAAKAHAFLRHRGYVTPDDVKIMGPDVLRHRLLLTYEAEAEEKTSEDLIRRIFETVEVP
jgi:MoxR-like ATPase